MHNLTAEWLDQFPTYVWISQHSQHWRSERLLTKYTKQQYAREVNCVDSLLSELIASSCLPRSCLSFGLCSSIYWESKDLLQLIPFWLGRFVVVFELLLLLLPGRFRQHTTSLTTNQTGFFFVLKFFGLTRQDNKKEPLEINGLLWGSRPRQLQTLVDYLLKKVEVAPSSSLGKFE